MRSLVTSLVCLAMIGPASAGCAGDPPPVVAPPPPPPEIALMPPPAPPPPPALPPKKGRQPVTDFKMDGHTLELPGPILFEVGSDRLSPASDEMLEIVHDYLNAKPDVTLLRIEGHTEGDGNAEANFVLSQKRAMTVARWLIGVGVRCDRLLPVGFGPSKALVADDSPEHKAQNRRVVFVNAALRGKPIGGLAVDGAGRPAGVPCQ